MGSDDLEAGIGRWEALSNWEGNDGCEIPGEVVLFAGFEFPVLYLFQLLETMLRQVLREPFNGMIGWDCVVNEWEEFVSQLAAAS